MLLPRPAGRTRVLVTASDLLRVKCAVRAPCWGTELSSTQLACQLRTGDSSAVKIEAFSSRRIGAGHHEVTICWLVLLQYLGGRVCQSGQDVENTACTVQFLLAVLGSSMLSCVLVLCCAVLCACRVASAAEVGGRRLRGGGVNFFTTT